METNNIFTESYDDPIIDDSLDNEIDILSTADETTIDYDEIPDYAAVSVDDDTRTVTLERFCEEFRQKLLSAFDDYPDIADLYFIDANNEQTHIQDISNLLYFAIWEDEYITTNNIPADVLDKRLMSFRVIKQCLKFKIDFYEYSGVAFLPDAIDTHHTTASVGTIIVKNEPDTNKIISIQDFAYLGGLEQYFDILDCYPHWDCEPEWTCDLDCTRIEYDEY